MPKKIVWKFTNQRELTKSQFMDYFERKVFRTIRKYNMLPKNKEIILAKSKSKSNNLNTIVLKKVIETKFPVKLASTKANFSSDNLSQVAEDTFKNILKGKFAGPLPSTKPFKPLYFLSDKEVELYASLVGIKITKTMKRKQDTKIQELFEKFLKKNQDLEQNIVNALFQLN